MLVLVPRLVHVEVEVVVEGVVAVDGVEVVVPVVGDVVVVGRERARRRESLYVWWLFSFHYTLLETFSNILSSFLLLFVIFHSLSMSSPFT